MPVYDYICHDCQKTFEEVLTLDEHDHETLKCPHAGARTWSRKRPRFSR